MIETIKNPAPMPNAMPVIIDIGICDMPQASNVEVATRFLNE